MIIILTYITHTRLHAHTHARAHACARPHHAHTLTQVKVKEGVCEQYVVKHGEVRVLVAFKVPKLPVGAHSVLVY